MKKDVKKSHFGKRSSFFLSLNSESRDEFKKWKIPDQQKSGCCLANGTL